MFSSHDHVPLLSHHILLSVSLVASLVTPSGSRRVKFNQEGERGNIGPRNVSRPSSRSLQGPQTSSSTLPPRQNGGGSSSLSLDSVTSTRASTTHPGKRARATEEDDDQERQNPSDPKGKRPRRGCM